MPSREKRARRRRRGSSILPALIFCLALVACALALMLVRSDPLRQPEQDTLPFSYPENPSFSEVQDGNDMPLVLGNSETPAPTQVITSATATPAPAAADTQATEEPAQQSGNRLVPTPVPGDYFLPVFDRALRTPNDEAMIAITVDDCTKPEVMSEIFDIARRYGVKLTLFPTGEALMTEGMTSGFRTCVRSMDFQLENHGFSHKREFKLSNSELAIQLWKQGIAADYAVGRDLEQHFYRPYNKKSDYDQRTHFYIGKLGYAGIGSYTHSYKDFDTVEEMVDTLENGKIYQFDMSDKSMSFFEEFIAAASRKGYKLVTMNELFGLNEDVVGRDLTIDQQTLITMEGYTPTYYDLKLNYQTNAVFNLQGRLMQLGYLVSPDGSQLKADGIYGADTSIAVGEFQAKVGLPATGNADVLTQEKLFALNAPPAG